MELVEYQCHSRPYLLPAEALIILALAIVALFIFAIKNRLYIRRLEHAADWHNTLLTSKLRTLLSDSRGRDRRIDVQEIQMLRLLSIARPVSMTEAELKKMRWVIQMLVFTLHYGMPLHLDRVCLEDYMNREGHSVRTYAEKYIYPEMFTTPNQMYNFGLEYLYGTGRAWEKDVVIARTWLEKAAAKGHVGAQTQLRLLG